MRWFVLLNRLCLAGDFHFGFFVPGDFSIGDFFSLRGIMIIRVILLHGFVALGWRVAFDGRSFSLSPFYVYCMRKCIHLATCS